MTAKRASGYSLIELLIVVVILGLIAAIAVPGSTSNDETQLDVAAEQFAAAIRFARSESIRTGEPHGFRFLMNQYRIRVYTVDTLANPWTWIWDVYNPVTKQLFDYTFPENLIGSNPPVVHSPVYRGACSRPGAVYFDASGTPWCLEPETVLLDSYRLDFVIGTAAASVSLDGVTGRVTIQ